MRTSVAPTSLSAFFSTPPSTLQAREREVMNLMADSIPRTRREIADALGWRDGPVCGRCASLIDKRELVEDGEKIEPRTGKKAAVLRLPARGQLIPHERPSEAEQGALFEAAA